MEVIKPGQPCLASKVNTNYNSSRSNPANNGMLLSLFCNFFSFPTSGNVPLTVQFFNDSDPSAISWKWDFGDGDSSNVKNPNHVYNTAGVYSVSLSISNGLNANTETKTSYISVSGLGVEEIINSDNILVYPNPYKANTNIAYEMHKSENVIIEVYSLMGKRLQTIVSEYQTPGSYLYEFSGKKFGSSSGIYLLKAQIGDSVYSMKLVEID